jgi:hypothetical protein
MPKHDDVGFLVHVLIVLTGALVWLILAVAGIVSLVRALL